MNFRIMQIKRICFTIVLICFSILLFVACKEERVAKSISLNEYSSEQPLEIYMGKFSYSDYTVTITYNNGEREVRSLSKDMISETDKLKFYQEGRNFITLAYKGAETSVEIKVSRNEFSDDIQLKDFTATYTGETFTVEVEGAIPGAAKILYPQGNTFKNAGSYDMTAILQCDGYVTKTLSARVHIEKATYDVTSAQLYDETVVYDKDAHSLTMKGKPFQDENGNVLYNPVGIPQGVSVRYTITKIKDGKGVEIAPNKQQTLDGNKATEAGVYRVCAQFKGDTSNYHAIEDSVAYLTVERATYDMSKIELADKTVTYSGEMHELSILEGSKLPLDVSVVYQIKQLKDGAGKVVDDTYKEGNTAINAGVYLVKALFSINGKNAENYKTAPEEKEGYLTIERASYDEAIKHVYLDMQWEEFVQGKTYEISFACKLPEGVAPQFVVIDENGRAIQGEMQTTVNETTGKTEYKYLFGVESAGEYSCAVSFVHNNENYDRITLNLHATFYISNVA